MNIQDEHSDDAINIASDLHNVLYEDDKMRVLKVSVAPGAHADMHWHPHNINYVTKAGKLRFSRPDSTTVDVDLSDGQITSATNDIYHAVDNIGDTVVETIQVELKY